MNFWTVWLGSMGTVGALCTAPFWLDRVIVALMRRFHVFLFPQAIRLAVSIERDSGWKVDGAGLVHPTIGKIRYATSVSILAFEVGDLEWKLNWIERRIVYNAVKQMLGRSIAAHMDRTLPT